MFHIGVRSFSPVLEPPNGISIVIRQGDFDLVRRQRSSLRDDGVGGSRRGTGTCWASSVLGRAVATSNLIRTAAAAVVPGQ